eukprot:CAMPEP_0196722230 /NCGR_PEP_ID=MMETSP1091-20130531/4630_1 /TAXON_ID=302021 /ORGANISM="Rhodomonas sp., Strain CCMP768" /LENGTH=82 /DNA_ID=CAMNT_0042063875 /DNA_START=369 /DNA_END=617 /DNA_ORIENTATION=-
MVKESNRLKVEMVKERNRLKVEMRIEMDKETAKIRAEYANKTLDLGFHGDYEKYLATMRFARGEVAQVGARKENDLKQVLPQ